MSLLLVAQAAALVAAAGIAFAPVGFLGASAATTVVKLAHLLCFATSWGTTVWGVFIGGIIMFLNLPRHMMGNLRRKVFPACFRLTAACTAASAAAFAWLHLPWRAASPAERRQLVLLAAAAGLDLANLLVFTPITIEVMWQRHKLERRLGIGRVGSFDGMRRPRRAQREPLVLALPSGDKQPVK
ncbi:transmembrane protein 205-like [Panicum virgatum]|uniref:transmembrane protein 205-like n=1 Tax=Panicum virgatum TaxID=38727 RepID=UPI0019D58C31|nr:transmembrane protein 205-like [Panicum virgatum]